MLGQFVLAALMASAQPTPAPKAAGQITAAVGKVTILRGGKALRASARSALYPGDRVETGPKSGAGAFFFAGQSVYLGDSTAIKFPAEADDASLQLLRGEARVTSDAPRGLTVAANQTRARVDRGTLRASADDQGSRFWAEAGPVQVLPGAEAPITLPSAQEVVVPNAGPAQPPTAPHPDLWKIKVDALQLSGAAAASRQLRGLESSLANSQLSPKSIEENAESMPVVNPTQPDVTGAESTLPTVNTPNNEAFQPVITAQPNTASSAFSSSLAFSAFAGSSYASTSGGLNPDAQQQSLKPGFAGDIFLITAQTQYTLNSIRLLGKDIGSGPGQFPSTRTYYSIALGKPTGAPIVTNFLTGATPGPYQTIPIPHMGAYVVKFNQYGIPDPALSLNASSVTGISGLLGKTPASPQVSGAKPLVDNSAVFNKGATFALGQFALQPNSANQPQIDIRRSDQDRQIIKSPTGNDFKDIVTLNPTVGHFNKVPDNTFFPQVPYVLKPQPNSILNKPSYAALNRLEKAAGDDPPGRLPLQLRQADGSDPVHPERPGHRYHGIPSGHPASRLGHEPDQHQHRETRLGQCQAAPECLRPASRVDAGRGRDEPHPQSRPASAPLNRGRVSLRIPGDRSSRISKVSTIASQRIFHTMGNPEGRGVAPSLREHRMPVGPGLASRGADSRPSGRRRGRPGACLARPGSQSGRGRWLSLAALNRAIRFRSRPVEGKGSTDVILIRSVRGADRAGLRRG